jgi:hypothetical protein
MIATEISHYAEQFHNSMEAYFCTDQLPYFLEYPAPSNKLRTPIFKMKK